MMLGAACWCAAMAAPDARAADKIIAGTLGGQAPLWPFYIAADKGFYAADNIDLELNFATSGASVIQQLTGGSLDAVVSVGLTEPLQAIDKGAPLALIRIIGKTAPYALVAKPTIKTIAGLRGKTISIGAIADIISIYFDRMMSANGLKKGDYDVLSAGVAAARYAALRAGEADAAMVLPPINFHAAAENYPTIGLAADYVKDVPFTGMIVSRAWGTAHRALARRLLDATSKSIAWLADTANRAEAIAILVKRAHATPGDAAASYDFKRRIAYFEPGDQVSRSQLQNLITIEAGQGYVDKALTVERLALPGLTELGP
jgi:ABC-type nitrate/sulfonate/bicarbonate transport system substrate-binding protein